jgi:hypothetical protein
MLAPWFKILCDELSIKLVQAENYEKERFNVLKNSMYIMRKEAKNPTKIDVETENITPFHTLKNELRAKMFSIFIPYKKYKQKELNIQD